MFLIFFFLLKAHVVGCEDRASFELFKNPIAPALPPESSRHSAPEPVFVPLPETENWDDVSKMIKIIRNYG